MEKKSGVKWALRGVVKSGENKVAGSMDFAETNFWLRLGFDPARLYYCYCDYIHPSIVFGRNLDNTSPYSLVNWECFSPEIRKFGLIKSHVWSGTHDGLTGYFRWQ